MTDFRNKYSVLQDFFGHSQFRNGQEQIIDSILAGRDCLGVMPTGAGKSMCYQIPALMFDGITIAISYCAAVSDEFRYAALTPDCISEFT